MKLIQAKHVQIHMQFMPRNFTIFKTNVICIVSFEGDIDIIFANGNKLISRVSGKNKIFVLIMMDVLFK